MNPSAPKSFRKAHAHYREAAYNLITQSRESYPIGTIIACDAGRSRITCEVAGHSSNWWYDPGKLHVRNIKTGKIRRVDPHSEITSVQIISLPGATKTTP